MLYTRKRTDRLRDSKRCAKSEELRSTEDEYTRFPYQIQWVVRRSESAVAEEEKKLGSNTVGFQRIGSHIPADGCINDES